VFFVSTLLLPWCIYASHNARRPTGRPCAYSLLTAITPTILDPFCWRRNVRLGVNENPLSYPSPSDGDACIVHAVEGVLQILGHDDRSIDCQFEVDESVTNRRYDLLHSIDLLAEEDRQRLRQTHLLQTVSHLRQWISWSPWRGFCGRRQVFGDLYYITLHCIALHYITTEFKSIIAEGLKNRYINVYKHFVWTAVDGNPLAGSTRVRGPTSADSYRLCLVLQRTEDIRSKRHSILRTYNVE